MADNRSESRDRKERSERSGRERAERPGDSRGADEQERRDIMEGGMPDQDQPAEDLPPQRRPAREQRPDQTGQGERSEPEQWEGQPPQEGFDEDLPDQHEEGLNMFTRGQLVHEAAILVRNLYGTEMHSLEPETYGTRQAKLGYYDLVDAWMVIAHMLDDEYHERFVKWAMPFPWSARTNRHLIPNFYLIAREGVQHAIDHDYIHPRSDHVYKFKFLAYFPPVTPPLAWYDVVSISKEDAIELAEILSGEGSPKGDMYKYLVQREKELSRELKRFTGMAKEAHQEAQRASDPDIEERKMESVRYYGRRATDVKQQLEDTKQRLESLRSQNKPDADEIV